MVKMSLTSTTTVLIFIQYMLMYICTHTPASTIQLEGASVRSIISCAFTIISDRTIIQSHIQSHKGLNILFQHRNSNRFLMNTIHVAASEQATYSASVDGNVTLFCERDLQATKQPIK